MKTVFSGASNQTRNQVRDSRLPAARPADKRNRVPCGNRQVQVFQHRFFRRGDIEGQITKLDLSFDRWLFLNLGRIGNRRLDPRSR